MKKKILALVLVFALAMTLGVGGTMAWLTSKTDTVVNTFTVGNITLELDEYIDDPAVSGAPTGEPGEENSGWLLTTANDRGFKIIPGTSDYKNPVLTVTAGSEECYVYAMVENNMVIGKNTVVTPDVSSEDWEEVATDGNKTLYRYKETVDVTDHEEGDNWSKSIFTQVVYSDTITMENISGLNGKTIVVKGFAHQVDNTDQATADAAAISEFKIEAEASTNP